MLSSPMWGHTFDGRQQAGGHGRLLRLLVRIGSAVGRSQQPGAAQEAHGGRPLQQQRPVAAQQQQQREEHVPERPERALQGPRILCSSSSSAASWKFKKRGITTLRALLHARLSLTSWHAMAVQRDNLQTPEPDP